MLEFTQLQNHEITMGEFTDGLSSTDLRTFTENLYAHILDLIVGLEDSDVIFQPIDPGAYDPYAENPEEVQIGWTLGHVIVHLTASNEEAAFLAAELARGVPHHGRSRYEVPWQSITTAEQVFQRIAESRRMCLASLDMWPDTPHLENSYRTREKSPLINPLSRFVYGIKHADEHLEQIAEIMHQARAARAGN
ncbi:MAG: DinB family protein [Anaerolineae bacterium]|nr:DinB family protein [Anaerolineae bacterium]